MLIVDLSNNNERVDFEALAKAGVRAVYLKATEGARFVDHYFADRRRLANRAGLRVGAYHFSRPVPVLWPARKDAIEEAVHFALVVKSIGRRDLRPALDFESGIPGPGYVAWARAWNEEVRHRLGVCPLFYSGTSYIRALGAQRPIGCGLWLASYGLNDGRRGAYEPDPPDPWRKYVLHQYTSRGHVDGVFGEVDMNYARAMRPLLAYPIRGLLSGLRWRKWRGRK